MIRTLLVIIALVTMVQILTRFGRRLWRDLVRWFEDFNAAPKRAPQERGPRYQSTLEHANEMEMPCSWKECQQCYPDTKRLKVTSPEYDYIERRPPRLKGMVFRRWRDESQRCEVLTTEYRGMVTHDRLMDAALRAAPSPEAMIRSTFQRQAEKLIAEDKHQQYLNSTVQPNRIPLSTFPACEPEVVRK